MSPNFYYKAKTATGEDKDGEIESLSEKDAAQKLRAQGLYPISISLVTDNMICPKCGKNYDSSWKECLSCKAPLKNVAPSKTEGQTTKKCPYCKGDVEINAVKCKHCGEWFGAISTRKILIVVGIVISLVIAGWLGGCLLKTYSRYVEMSAMQKEKSAVDARENCIANLKEIYVAIDKWGIDNGKEGVIPTWEDLVPKYIKTKPVCPAGGTYELGADGIPRCSIEGHKLEDAEAIPKYQPEYVVPPTIKPTEIIVGGILVDGNGKKSVIINDNVVSEGNNIGDIKIDSINKDSVDITLKGKKIHIKENETYSYFDYKKDVSSAVK